MTRGYILVQGDDIKTAQWRIAAKKYGLDIVPTPGSPMYWPINFVRNSLQHGFPQAVVFRYLNDYPQLWKSLLRLLSESLCVLLCLLFRVRIIWLCHNVDRESAAHHPQISRLRRSLLRRYARSILVTDRLLVPHARAVLRPPRQDVGFVTFGEYQRRSNEPAAHEFTMLVKERFYEWRATCDGSGSRLLIGLCAGSPSWKMAHYALIPQLIESARSCGVEIRMVVAGPIGSFLMKHCREVHTFLSDDPRIFFWNGYVPIAEHDIAPYIDFYWRAYRDLSVPMSVYTAASVGKPILALEMGFLPEMIRAYNLGAVLRVDMTNIAEALADIESWRPCHARRFLEEHNWDVGALNLVRASGCRV